MKNNKNYFIRSIEYNEYVFTLYSTNVINTYKVDDNIIGAPKI